MCDETKWEMVLWEQQGMFINTIVRRSHKVHYLLQFQRLGLFSKVNSLIILHIFIALFAETREEESKKCCWSWTLFYSVDTAENQHLATPLLGYRTHKRKLLKKHLHAYRKEEFSSSVSYFFFWGGVLESYVVHKYRAKWGQDSKPKTKVPRK